MFFVIAFISLIILMVLHELGHFSLAKIFKMEVEEFGIGYPPRIIGKKIGQTVYSLNFLPFGAFVKILGEEDRSQSLASFNSKPFYQKALVVLGGVATFWIVSIVLLSLVMVIGIPTIVDDTALMPDAKVQIYGISSTSPALGSGIKVGDAILQINETVIEKTSEVLSFTSQNKGKDIVLKLQRGKEVFEVSLKIRSEYPNNEGPLGIVLVRTAVKKIPFYLAPVEASKATFNLTVSALQGWYQAIVKLFKRQPTGVQLMGPVGILTMFAQVSELGVNYFLQFIAVISIFIALFNILPIPVTDGGRLLFLIIEKIRRKPMNFKLEQGINAFFFAFLIIIMILVTISDISKLF